ncbi:hypothetical protein BU16DRAFT_119591 [Lophium mytilinum]|uniref:Uncharacterized protein n=1 Tax=Lophium mytilinum TaxID=390894 RepID=A0A6A6QHL9_9PEZI|nr:hypothetical protein BU16DRAFT_119591 [Lophium mytilinum]
MLRDVANLESHYEKVWANIVGLQSSQTEDVERELNSLLNSAHQTEDGDQATYIANMLANINRPHKDEDSSPAAPVLQKSSANETKLMENYRTRAQEHIDTYRQDLDSNVSLGGSGDGGIRRPSHGDTAMGTSPISRRGSIIPPAMRGAIDDAANSTGDIVMGGTEEATAQSPPPAFNSTYGRDISRDPRRK